jgi:hypothetical protein
MTPTPLPSHIASLDRDDQDLYLAWCADGGNTEFDIDRIHDWFIAARDTEEEIIQECVFDWMERNRIRVDPRIAIDYTKTFWSNKQIRRSYSWVEQGDRDRLFAFRNELPK